MRYHSGGCLLSYPSANGAGSAFERPFMRKRPVHVEAVGLARQFVAISQSFQLGPRRFQLSPQLA
jgi:hypothetical protein